MYEQCTCYFIILFPHLVVRDHVHRYTILPMTKILHDVRLGYVLASACRICVILTCIPHALSSWAAGHSHTHALAYVSPSGGEMKVDAIIVHGKSNRAVRDHSCFSSCSRSPP